MHDAGNYTQMFLELKPMFLLSSVSELCCMYIVHNFAVLLHPMFDLSWERVSLLFLVFCRFLQSVLEVHGLEIL